jgi:hypothetical protein
VTCSTCGRHSDVMMGRVGSYRQWCVRCGYPETGRVRQFFRWVRFRLTGAVTLGS